MPDQTDALRSILRQSEMAGASRCALLLHTDRLPPSLAKPHHQRLAREAFHSLADADRAQFFELTRGRIAVIWRARTGTELGPAREALGHLLSGQPDGSAPDFDDLVSLYTLPDDAVSLLDVLADEMPERAAACGLPMDLQQLAELEAALAQADLSPFARWRAIKRLSAAGPRSANLARIEAMLAWEERYFAVHAIAAGLFLERGIKADAWLFRRVTRSLDRRMLALLSGPRELSAIGPLAINVNVATILSAEFLRFDEDLPVTLRGAVVLNLRPADSLAEGGGFVFARNFAKARSYRLALVGATPPLLKVLDCQAAGFDYVQVKWDADLMGGKDRLGDLVPTGVELIVTGLERDSDVRGAVANGASFGQGRAL